MGTVATITEDSTFATEPELIDVSEAELSKPDRDPELVTSRSGAGAKS